MQSAKILIESHNLLKRKDGGFFKGRITQGAFSHIIFLLVGVKEGFDAFLSGCRVSMTLQYSDGSQLILANRLPLLPFFLKHNIDYGYVHDPLGVSVGVKVGSLDLYLENTQLDYKIEFPGITTANGIDGVPYTTGEDDTTQVGLKVIGYDGGDDKSERYALVWEQPKTDEVILIPSATEVYLWERVETPISEELKISSPKGFFQPYYTDSHSCKLGDAFDSYMENLQRLARICANQYSSFAVRIDRLNKQSGNCILSCDRKFNVLMANESAKRSLQETKDLVIDSSNRDPNSVNTAISVGATPHPQVLQNLTNKLG